MTKPLQFIDNPAAGGEYTEITIDCEKAFQSWKASLYSFEWIDENGAIKDTENLPESEAEKRTIVETALNNNAKIEKPVMGFGMLDNIEIGSGRAVFLTLYDRGIKSMPVHIKKSTTKDFKDFLSEGKE